MPKNKVQCECGDQVAPGYQAYHAQGWWHKNYKQALELRDRGLSYAEIARQLGSSRVYVSAKMRHLKWVEA